MKYSYPAIFRPAEKGMYEVWFPDLDNCFIRIYESLRGNAIGDLRQLLISYNYEITNLIRITYKDGKTSAILFQE